MVQLYLAGQSVTESEVARIVSLPRLQRWIRNTKDMCDEKGTAKSDHYAGTGKLEIIIQEEQKGERYTCEP